MTADPDFGLLRRRHPVALVEALVRLAQTGGSFRVTARQLASESVESKEAALELLRDPSLTEWLQETERLICPHCGEGLTPEEAAQELCPFDEEVAFSDHGGVRLEFVFIHKESITRDVRWALALHGMNTVGAWQEEFNWLFSRTYGGGYMVPVAIYKYGVIRPGVLARWRQRQLMRELIGRIQRLSGEAEGDGFGGRPDVIAHSFGTWLLGHALMSDPDLRVGRVILLGCILRPDFDWHRLVERGQVEAILNHCGSADRWVRVAQRVIPCSGPSGLRGFEQVVVHDIPAPGFKHSEFFDPKEMPGIFQTLWRPFLTWPLKRLSQLPGGTLPDRQWRSSRWRIVPRRDRCSLPPPAACH